MTDYRKVARTKARKYGIDPDRFVAQIQQESGFNPDARSPAGADGIAQIMPATAKGWGVNTRDPVASLDAAAKNMAAYEKKYGGPENALRAYNAGPGAIEKSKGYRETNDYVKRIMGASRSSSTAVPPAAERRRTVSASADAEVSSIDTKAYEEASRRFALAEYVGKRNPNSILLKALPRTAPLMADFTKTRTETVTSTGSVPARARASAPARARGGKRPAAQLLEMFYDPEGGIKNGQEIGAIGGHGDHVHVASGPKQLAALKPLIKGLGLTITSTDEGYSGDGVHTPTSNHYKGKAYDVAGSPDAMRRFYRQVKGKYTK